MTIEEAKADLEQKIILWDGVIGIGIVNENTNPVIEIAIDKNEGSIVRKLNELINGSFWNGYNVKIVPAEGFKFH